MNSLLNNLSTLCIEFKTYIEGINNANIQVNVYDLQGKLIYQRNNSNVINISHIKQGVYFTEIKSPTMIYRTKIIKQ